MRKSLLQALFLRNSLRQLISAMALESGPLGSFFKAALLTSFICNRDPFASVTGADDYLWHSMTSQLLRLSLVVNWDKVQVEDKTLRYAVVVCLYGVGQ